MTIHTAGSLPPVPVNALDGEGQPPAHHPPSANVPTLLVPSLAPSPLQLPQEPDVALPSTEPTISSNAMGDGSPRLASPTAKAFDHALRRNDYETAHRMLDQGVDLTEDYFGRPLLLSVLQFETDAETIHRILELLDPATRHEMASKIYDTVIHYNAVALECLIECKLVQEKPGADDLLALLQRAALFKSPEMLGAAVRLWCRYVPHRMPELDCLLGNIGPHAKALRAFSAIGRLDLMDNLKVVSEVLLEAIQGHQEEAARVLIDWLKQSDEFGTHRRLPLMHLFDRLGDDALCLLARAGLPFGLYPDSIPMFEKRERAAEFRAALYGEDLASSPLMQWMANDTAPASQLFDLVRKCWYASDRQRNFRGSAYSFFENALYTSGFLEPVAKEFACLLDESGNCFAPFNQAGKFVLYARVNELQASPALAACPDPQVQRQLSAIVTAAQEMIESLIGPAQALVADLLRCIRPHGKVEFRKLHAFVRNKRGIPETVWQQLHALLKQSVAQALESPVDLPTGLTLRDAQAALHEQLQIRVFRRLLTEMPRSLQSREMTVRANEAELSDEERIAQHAAIEVLTQYCEQLAQDPDREILAILALVKTAADEDSDDSSSSDS